MKSSFRKNVNKILRIVLAILTVMTVAVITFIIILFFTGGGSNADVFDKIHNTGEVTDKEKEKIKHDMDSLLKQWLGGYKNSDIKSILDLHDYTSEEKDALKSRLEKELSLNGEEITFRAFDMNYNIKAGSYVSIDFKLEVEKGGKKTSGKVQLDVQRKQNTEVWKIKEEKIFPEDLLVFSSPPALITPQATIKPKSPGENSPEEYAFYGVKDREIREIMESMTLEEKVGQLFMIGFEGQDVSSVYDRIQQLKPGGIIIFKRNFSSPHQMYGLTEELQKAAVNKRIKLLIATDQEGGRVVNICNDNYYFPSNLEIGDGGNESYAKEAGNALGDCLTYSGINMDLAPVLDLYNSGFVVGPRSFGESKAKVAAMGLSMTEGLMEKKVIPTIKHFPGHGATPVDSHSSLPLVKKTREELKSHFYPFDYVIKHTSSDDIVVMVGHIEYTDLDYLEEEVRPASLSQKIVAGILRQEMGFEGVVMTDDMEMEAITDYYSVEEAAVKALKAGVDIILICHTSGRQWSAYDAVLSAVKNNKIPESRIDSSVARILLLKKKYGLLEQEVL